MTRLSRLVAVAGVGFASTAAHAFDVGAPTFYDPERGGPRHVFETAFVWYERDVVARYSRRRIGPPGASAPTGIGTAPPDLTAPIDAEYTQLRWTYHAAPRLSTQLEIGLDGETNEGDSVVILGGAVRYLIASHGPLALAAQGSANVIPEYRSRSSGRFSTGEDFVSYEQSRLHEYDLALLGSLTACPHEDVRLMTYFGPRLSSHRGGVAAVLDVDSPTPGADARLWVDFNTEEETVLGAVVGVQAEWRENWTLRAEARLGNEASFTIGLGAGF